MYACYTTPRFFLLFVSILIFFPTTSQTKPEEGTLEICTQKHYTRNCEHDDQSKRIRSKKRRKAEEQGRVFLQRREEKNERNITIALFNPDRATNKHVVPSFKNGSVFFFLPVMQRHRQTHRERESKGKKRRTVLNIIIIMRINMRETNEQATHTLLVFSVSPGDLAMCVQNMFMPDRREVRREFSFSLSLKPPLFFMNTHYCLLSPYVFFSSYIFPGGLESYVNARKRKRTRKEDHRHCCRYRH